MDDLLNFWNSRAGLKEKAGTNDLIAKQLEIETIKTYIHNGDTILDFGCGNGFTAIEIAKEFQVKILGIDFSEEMIKSADENLSLENDSELKGEVKFIQGSINELLEMKEQNIEFDIVYTERMIINLKTWEEQKDMIRILCSMIKKENGKYLMCENSMDGLNFINEQRKKLNLPEIIPPWHNRYLYQEELREIEREGSYHILFVDMYSALYYFLSRIVNAYFYNQIGEEPIYDSIINQLALHLYQRGDICSHVRGGDYAQGRLFFWVKNDNF